MIKYSKYIYLFYQYYYKVYLDKVKAQAFKQIMNGQSQNRQGPRYKIILVGDVNVGKTALFWRYIQGQFLAHKNTLVTTVDFKMKNIVIDNTNIKLYLWDTAGSQQYRSIVATYFKGCHGVAVVFDLTRQGSFRNAIDYWIPLAKSKTPGAIYILIGNKSDLDVRVSRQQVQKWTKQNNIYYIQTSVKANKNVVQAFDWLGHRIHEHQNTFLKSQSFALDGKNKLSMDKRQKKCCKS